MSLKLCVGPHMLSTVAGTAPARTYYPQVIKETFLGSTKDGEIERSPDPVTMISGDLPVTNSTKWPLWVRVLIHRAPRSIVSTNPVTVIINDAYSWAVGVSPQAEYPSVGLDQFGGKLMLDRASTGPDDLKYGRYFLDCDDSQSYVTIGELPPGESLHFRYLAAVQTPGVWTKPSDGQPMYSASAYWTRLTALAVPVLGD
ncbi:DUF7172 family protein [Mycolicibacterium mucogenicum]|uniref:DUF7172 domain-containing protein n=1 Tax=Mycolicibacterium mucogenicum DSM 44124 TaxID=1226753 RepID=A0A8H2J8W4_MYCMU|nr:hypothetical protein [Mycolicibacterium mucogenicum]KAB7761174.1 hypothetical protein MMUC44124_00820 [Mycolicibacterium mucogenicum DSM 44124]QPG69979.1 hypothetical protein C1S78_002815 [Mycolicibacterium mucogenicum DSM 44124]